jgi:NADH:flavin oxidoreductases, Old Yellow Enzyme family
MTIVNQENQQVATTTSGAPLFAPLTLRGITLRNRIAVSPMCQYSAADGIANDWHLVHLGGFAVGGAALVMTEATAVEPRGRITPQDLGLWSDEQIAPLARITKFIRDQGAQPAVQLAHAGRKASTYRPWGGSGELRVIDGAWQTVGPSAERFADNYPFPHALSGDEITEIVHKFQTAAQRALQAGFKVLEIHAAHGYLLHQFISPLSNHRTDEYGGSLENRMRFLLEVVDAVRQVMPQDLPLLVRLSATDWTEGGVTSDETVKIAQALAQHGVDLVDVSTGGNVAHAKIPVGPDYQVPFADAVRNQGRIASGAVGLITEPAQANQIVQEEKADVIFLARELLRDPHWPLRAAHALDTDITWPKQYERARF